MEWSPAKVLIIIAAVSGVIELTAAANHTVGSPGQWDLRTNLTRWAATTTFHAGDNLLFTYDSTNHNVLEVNRSSYDNCSAGGPIQTHRSGNDVIALPQEGTRYFICGFPTHCTLGMKIQVVTKAAEAPSPASQPNSPPPSSSSTPVPPTSGGSSPPPESGTSADRPTSSPSAADGKVAVAGITIAVGLIALLLAF